MAIKDIISPGIGFSPGSVQYIVTRGFGIGVAPTPVEVSTSGGAVKLKKRRKRFTEEEIKGLEVIYGKKAVVKITKDPDILVSEPSEIARKLEIVPLKQSPFKPLEDKKPPKVLKDKVKDETNLDIEAQKLVILKEKERKELEEKAELEEIQIILALVSAHDPLN